MTSELESLLTLCRFLSPWQDEESTESLRRLIEADAIDWTALIGLANRHMVTPALRATLQERGLSSLAPADAHDFLSHIYKSNELRNTQIKDQAEGLIHALNDAEVVPIVLKGGATLFEASADAIGRRMMIDLDVLVPGDRLNEAENVLTAMGYTRALQGDDSLRSHDRAFFRHGDQASVELHRNVGMQRTILSNEEAFDASLPLQHAELKMRVLSPTHRVLHNVFHHQIQNRKQTFGFVEIKDTLDFALLEQRFGDAIEWEVIERAMRGRRAQRALSSYRYLSQKLYGAPEGGKRPLSAKIQVKRSLFQIQHPRVLRTMQFLAGLSHPLGRCYIEYAYECEGKFLAVNLHRVRRSLTMLRRYRGQGLSAARQRAATFYEN